ncbi:MAG: AmmeMemoRadiSam system protein A [Acidobacteriota bacterium]
MNELNTKKKKFLLNLARKAIEEYLKKGNTISPEIKENWLKEKKGAFVTLKVGGNLRGCIGYPLPYKSLYETIIDVAISAATSDFRFEPLSVEELDETEIEITILSIPKEIKSYDEIEIGKHGIIVSKGAFQGLLLPQVPVEYNWDLETYLTHGCMKAGLKGDEWKRGIKVEIFSGEVFSDREIK